ncbi:MAG: Ig-like domain-containing protein [Bacteroidales bacterium]|nr:Ig-like domain-containing protein [Bacteroidales bacterium]
MSRHPSIILLVLLLLASCAKQGYPTGGPKDTRPPELVATKPANGTMDFAAKEFFLEFDEYVNIKDAENNVIVSPPMKYKPEYTTKGHGIRVRLRDTLQPDATYLFQFKGAIVDFNEGNPLPSLEYVFSTGSSIDSMALLGTVVDALTGQPRKESLTVMAYPAESLTDSTAMLVQPTYITRAGADGNFAFNHIKAGKYHLVAIVDDDKNMRLAATEAMAFLDTLVPACLMGDSVPLTLRIADSDVPKPQRVLKSGYRQRAHAFVVLAQPAVGLQVGADSVRWRLCHSHDTIDLWHLNPECDTMIVTLTDSAGLADTLKLVYRARQSMRRQPQQLQPQSKNFVRALRSGSFAYFDTVRFVFESPATQLRHADSAVMVLCLADSSLTYYPLQLTPDSTGATIDFTPKQSTAYRITLLPRTIADLYGHWNDTLAFGLQATRPEDYGNIILHFNPDTAQLGPAYLVQLLDTKGQVVEERRAAGAATLRFEHLKPATYTLRAIADRNANGRWDCGNYPSRRQPEDVMYIGKDFELRANWDVEERMDWQSAQQQPLLNNFNQQIDK